MRPSVPSASAQRSASVSPHHGARSTASQASRSAGCAAARVSASRSCTTGRRPSCSISIARKRNPAARSRGTIRSRWLRLRTSTATVRSGSRPFALDELDDARRLALIVAVEERMHLDRGPGERRMHRGAARVRHRARRGVLARRHHRTERTVDPVDNPGLRTEVGGEANRLERNRADPPARPGAEELPDLGLAKAVNRLHRVADREQRPAVAPLPAGGEARNELVLADRGVLELVHQDVPHLVVEREREIGRRVVVAERAERGLRDLGEIHLPARREYDAERRDRVLEEVSDGFEHFPLRVGVGRGWQLVQRHERRAQQLGIGARFERLRRRRLLAPCPILRQQRLRERLPCLGPAGPNARVEGRRALDQPLAFVNERRLERRAVEPTQSENMPDPVVATAEHPGQQRRHVLDVVVEIAEQTLDVGRHRLAGLDQRDRRSRRLEIQVGRVLDHLARAAEPGQDRHLARERGAQRIDRLDAETRRIIVDSPILATVAFRHRSRECERARPVRALRALVQMRGGERG